jgi:GTPase SAR1 family protein/predicted MPP superfamily phosphohydrolase
LVQLAIVQLSDIHIKTADDLVLQKAHKIVSAIKSVSPTATAYLLAVTGDIAYSGIKDQYELALSFLSAIRDGLLTPDAPVLLFCIPGNHDLDFLSEPDTREALLQHVRKNPEKVDPNGETVKQILSVQNNFFKFEATLLHTTIRPENGRLAYSHSFTVAGSVVRIHSFNTAWVSTNPEVPGTLVFPTFLVKEPIEPAALEISAFHHPTNWLTPDNGRAFRTAIERSSDIIFTGHEHETSVYRKQDVDTGDTEHVEGAVLQVDGSSDSSSFHVVLVDDRAATYEVFLSIWNKDMYMSRSVGVRPFVRNRMARQSAFQHSASFAKSLSDPGLPILHPRKHDIVIDDLFVYPAFARKDPEKKFQLLRIIEGRDVLEYVRSTSRLVIVGDEMSGKTCLAKKMCRDFLTSGAFVPIIVTGRSIEGSKERDIRRMIRAAVEEQYGEEWIDRYLDLDATQRTIIVDDWHELKYTGKSKGAIVEQLKARFGKVIFLTNRLYALEELAEVGPARQTFAEFEFCDIKEFGKRSTGQLIEKWHSLGQEETLDLRDFHYAVACSEDKVAAVIRKGILPTFPIFIIGLLQADTSSSSGSSRSAGAYGHILELIITDRLSMVSKSATDIGTMYTYLSRIAYRMYKNDRLFLSGQELSEVHAEYCTIYKMRLSETRVIADLVQAKIIRKEADSYRFSYKGLYCYGVARYLFENMAQSESTLRPELDEMTDRLAWEDYSNIVMFYLYLSRDPKTIERLLDNASKIYAECEPANLDGDVLFVNRLMKERPQKIALPSADISLNREEFRKKQDAMGQENDTQVTVAPDNRVPYAPALHELVKLTIGLQTLRVMGQVLRNFPGVLTAEPKFRLTRASYLLGLRILRRVLDLAQNQMQALRINFAEILRENHPLSTQEELEERGDQALIWLTGAAAYGVIKRICRSVGLKDLELTFEEVRTKLERSTSVGLVHLSICLEYFRDAPKSQIYELEKALRKNPFAYKILRDLVSEFLYLRNTDFRLSQEMGALFEIETSKPEYMLNKALGVGAPGKEE